MPYKFRERKVKEAKPKNYLGSIVAVILLLGIIASLPYVWGRYQARNERRRLARAQEALGRGDAKAALLEARSVLARSPQNPVAQDVMDKANAAMKAPDFLSWPRTTSAMESGDTDQLLALAEGFLAAADYTTAENALAKVDQAHRATARYEDLLAQLAAGRNDVAAAQKHWDEAARLAPGDEHYRIPPIAMRLLASDPAERADALEKLAALKQTEKGALPAQRALLADARLRADLSTARELAAELGRMPGAEFKDKIALLDTLHALRPKREDEFNASLSELQKLAEPDPQDFQALASWLLDHELTFVVAEWAAKLPPDYFSQPPAAPLLAQAYARTSDWKRLKQLVESGNWGEDEFMRLAFVALALDRQGNRKASETIWQDAFAAAQLAPDRLERLLRACGVWGWREHVDDVAQKLGASEWCPRWVMEYLWSAAHFHKDTARLQEAARLKLRTDPGNVTMRNNLANLSLLLGAADEATHREARAVHEEEPESAEIAATYGLSLFLQGRVHEAVSVMEAYSADQLRSPEVALYFGAFLAAAGQTDRGPEFLQRAERAPKFPEEAALARVFSALCEVRRRQQRDDEPGAHAAWTEALRGAERQPAWLDLLAKTAIEWNWAPGAEAALLKLASEDRCPPGAEDSLWAAAVKTGNATQIYRASRLIARVRPNDPAARSRYVLLAVLGQRSKESPVAMAEQLVKDFPNSSDAAAALALALLQQGKVERAAAVMDAVPAEHRPEPRVALYSGIVFAVAGRLAEAGQLIETGAVGALYEEERTLISMIESALATVRSEKGGDAGEAKRQWAQALSIAADRADWVEMLARIATSSGTPGQADAALWKLAEGESCPGWAVAALWESASKNGTSNERYRASKLVTKSDPKNLVARCIWIVLGLLTHQELDAPDREAKAAYAANVTDPDAAVAYALSLFLQKQREEALKVLGGLPAARLAEPRTSLYYGVFLAAGGDLENAANYLRAGAQAKIFPEERAFASRVVTAEPLKIIMRSGGTAAQ